VAGWRIGAEDADAFLARHTVLNLLRNLDAEALKRAVTSELWPRN
jgi:hypothetical protein